MRRRPFASLSLALVLVFTTLGFCAQALADQQLDRIVAVVNDDAIMASELENRVAQARSQLASRNIAMPSIDVLRSQVLERMIIEQIQLQMAEQANLSIDDTELNRAVRGVAEGRGPDCAVRDLMSDGIICARDDEDVAEVAQRMSDEQVRRLPVLDSSDRLVGIVSLGDLSRETGGEAAHHALDGVSEAGGQHQQ